MGMGGERLDRGAISASGPLAGDALRLRSMLAEGALVWLRCCSAFGTAAGQSFARALADTLGARAAGHTFIIGAWQSGTSSCKPGERPSWSEREGVEARPGGDVALTSHPKAPRTITCLHFGLPDDL
jgi:hypothetical protein